MFPNIPSIVKHAQESFYFEDSNKDLQSFFKSCLHELSEQNPVLYNSYLAIAKGNQHDQSHVSQVDLVNSEESNEDDEFRNDSLSLSSFQSPFCGQRSQVEQNRSVQATVSYNSPPLETSTQYDDNNVVCPEKQRDDSFLISTSSSSASAASFEEDEYIDEDPVLFEPTQSSHQSLTSQPNIGSFECVPQPSSLPTTSTPQTPKRKRFLMTSSPSVAPKLDVLSAVSNMPLASPILKPFRQVKRRKIECPVGVNPQQPLISSIFKSPVKVELSKYRNPQDYDMFS